jgi:2-oxo-4-hydroxy-4-carboxy--5-ureidoimidazoline (OHCU) decarboxylase
VTGPAGSGWTLDAPDDDAFVAAVAPLFEGAPLFLARLAAARPFGSAEAMFGRARGIAHAMPEDEQLELIDAHPRLGAPPGSVSAFSFVEQGYGPDAAQVAAAAERLRVAREELLPGMEAALSSDHDREIARALDAVIDIAADRYARPRD